MANLFETYQKRVEKLPVYLQDEVGILYSSVLTVAEIGNQERDRPSEVDDFTKATLNDFYNNEGGFVKLSDLTSQSFLYHLIKNSEVYLQMRDPVQPVVISADDQLFRKFFQIRAMTSGTTASQGNSSSFDKPLLEFEYEARTRLHISRLLAGGILPLRAMMSEVERGIKESELLTFTSLAASDLYRSNQLQEFSDMILEKTKALPNFTGSLSVADGEEGNVLRRKYFKSISAFLLAQLLSQELRTDPLVLKKYYPMTDELLLSLHWPPPDRRNIKTLWQRTIMSEEPNPEEEMKESSEEKKEEVEGEGEGEEVARKGREVVWETVTMTPAGQMIATVHRLNHDNAHSWMTAQLNNYMIGVRMTATPNHDNNNNTTSEETNNNNNASSSTFHFFCETSDRIRYLAYPGPSLTNNKKPDKHGTVCLTAQFPHELQIQIHSNGDIRLISEINHLLSENTFYDQLSKQKLYPLFPEKSRFITEQGRIIRHFHNPRQLPFSHEIFHPDGTRDLFLHLPFYQFIAAQTRRDSLFYSSQLEKAMKSPRTPHSNNNPSSLNLPASCIEMALLLRIPKNTFFIRFLVSTGDDDGKESQSERAEIECYNENYEKIVINQPLTFSQFSLAVPATHRKQSNFPQTTSTTTGTSRSSDKGHREVIIDAESKSVSSYFPDGRLITEYKNGIKIVQFADGTKFTHNKHTKMLMISRHVGYPEIEMDVDVDSTCRKHSQGMEIPINKGGERVRTRIAFPDGSAAFIKYDTRVVAKCNGSIKLVRRDRTAMIARDDGSFSFHPSTTWTSEDEDKFLADCKVDDLEAKGASSPLNGFDRSVPSLPSSSNNNNNNNNQTNIKTTNTATTPASATGFLPPALVSRRRGTAAIGMMGGNNNKTVNSRQSSSHSPPPGTAMGHNVFSSNHEPDAVITVDLVKGRCSIKDYEFNSFEINLSPSNDTAALSALTAATLMSSETINMKESSLAPEITNSIEASDSLHLSDPIPSSPSPLDVKVELAGEVPGLKPPAVARSPKPPRLFIIGRTGEAMEVMSIQEVKLLEHQAKINADVMKHSSIAALPPNELGPATQWRYFIERKFIGSYLHGYLFREIFGHRVYQSVKMPASSLFFLDNRPSLHYRRESEIGWSEPGRVFEAVSLIERLPVSKEGYNDITISIHRCEQFRQDRMKSIDRFAVEDPRSLDQIKEEEDLTKRLKQVYKQAKINAAKKKKAKGGAGGLGGIGEDGEGDEDASATKQPHSLAASGGGSGPPLSARSAGSNPSPEKKKEYKPSKGNETIKEGDHEDEDGEQEDEDDHFGSDDEDGEVDPEEAAVRAVFDDFSSQSDVEGFMADVIPVNSLQEAFVRILNQFVSQDLIDKAILDSDEVDVNLEEFTLPEFRLIFQSLQKQLQFNEEQKGGYGFNDDDNDNNNEPCSPLSPDHYQKNNNKFDFDDYHEGGKESYRPHSNDEVRSLPSPSSRAKESYYNNNNNNSNNNTLNGQRRSSNKTAPPLNLTGILSAAAASGGAGGGGKNNEVKVDEDMINSMDSIYSNDGNVAVGLPMNAVRRAKNAK